MPTPGPRRTSSRRRLAPVLAAGLACLLLLTGCNSLSGTGDQGFVTSDGSVKEVSTAHRGDAVTLTGRDLDGHDLDLSSFRGKPVVVVVWGSWCTPCRAEAPDVVEAAKQLGDSAQFVGINIRDGSTDQARSFVRRFGVRYPSFYSPDGQALLPFQGTLSPNSIPSFVVLDDQGRVAASIIGQLPSTTTLVDVVKDVSRGSAHG
jgi:thiol-disulfide isomerase/thioredoxin